MNVRIERVTARLHAPFVSVLEAVGSRELLLLRLEDADGYAGWGEAAPLPAYDGVSIEEAHRALEACRAALSASDGSDARALLARCEQLAGLPQALAAIDLALWDLAGRRAGAPVWRLLGAAEDAGIEANATIAAVTPEDAAIDAARARAAGFKIVKVKVGTGEDVARVAAIRTGAGEEIAIRVDANGAWSVQDAIESLRELEPLRIELCEEPTSGLGSIAQVASSSHVPLALDESTSLDGALDHRVCDAVSLKITGCGGITGTVQAARRARSAGYEVYLGSTFDGPLGIAAALHTAAVIRPDRACGLATLGMFAGREDPLQPQHGTVPLPPGPGLGNGLLAWYSASG